MLVVSAAGIVALEANERFEKEIAAKRGLRDVFKLKRKYLSGKINECPSKEEIDNYIREREEYIANEILKECGWEEFVKRCRLVGIEDYTNEHFHCEGPDRQCKIFCPQYNTNCWSILVIEGNNISFQEKSVN